MTTAEMTRTSADMTDIMEKVLIKGDLSKLSEAERVNYYMRVCESVGVNPLTQPFSYIVLNGKLTLYALKACTDQIRKVHRVSISDVRSERLEDVYIVTARATMPDGRTDESTGVVSLAGLKGEALANCLMRCETKAKRRVTLSIIGLGMLDESEVETIPGAQYQSMAAKPSHRDALEVAPGVPQVDRLKDLRAELMAVTGKDDKTLMKQAFSELELKVVSWDQIAPHDYDKLSVWCEKQIEEYGLTPKTTIDF